MKNTSANKVRYNTLQASHNSTLQVLPKELQAGAIKAIARCVAVGGTLLVIARGREMSDPSGNMPWPLLKADVDSFNQYGLKAEAFEDYVDGETPPVRRFRAEFSKAAPSTA
jgi:hypothetical protein